MNLDVTTNEGDSTTSSNTISTGSDVEEGLCTSSNCNSGTTSDKGQDDDAEKEVKVCKDFLRSIGFSCFARDGGEGVSGGDDAEDR